MIIPRGDESDMAIDIPSEDIAKAVSIYRPEWRFVRSAKVEFPNISVLAYVPDTLHTIEPLSHLSGIEAQACINQVAYILGHYAVKNGMIPEITEEDFFMHAKDHMLIAESFTKIKFKNPIEKSINSTTEISIDGKVQGLRKRGNSYYAFVDFDFSGKADAKMSFVIEY